MTPQGQETKVSVYCMTNFETPILELELSDPDELVEEVCTSTEYSNTGFREVDILPDHDVPV